MTPRTAPALSLVLVCIGLLAACAQVNRPVPASGDPHWAGTAAILTQPAGAGPAGY